MRRDRAQLAAILRRTHARDPRLARALGRMWRARERQQMRGEAQEQALLDRCWWRRQERAEALRAASAENETKRKG